MVGIKKGQKQKIEDDDIDSVARNFTLKINYSAFFDI